MNKNITIPWVEKYRPTNFENIVLDSTNQTILNNILKFKNFPNLLLYGPPGTGKTTTIINLINKYNDNDPVKNKELIIHLNASDDRGIDIIRNKISTFVNSKNLFVKGLKIVILDEIDYMTKSAQLALKHLIQINNNNVRYCLICNYISRIDESLQNDFVKLRFNNLPSNKIISFLNNINNVERINLNNEQLKQIQSYYKSDIRSMINFMQINIYQINNINVINSKIWENLLKKLNNTDNIKSIERIIQKISIDYETSVFSIIKTFVNYLLKNHLKYNDKKYLDFFESLFHIKEIRSDIFLKYFITKFNTINM